MANHPNRKKSSTATVVLLHERSGFVNVSDIFRVIDPADQYVCDELKESIEVYYLPDGYTWAEGRDGGLYVYGPDGKHREIVEFRSSGRPQLWGELGQESPVLKRKLEVAA